jgi:O-antigen/teichoic acid export membrane protein
VGDSNVTVANARPRTELVWGVVDQGFSSGTNLALSILAGQLLGPSGLGVIFLGFSMYLLALSFLRALITEPFMVATSARGQAEREAATRACMILVLVVAGATSLLMAVVGLVLTDPLGRSLLIFSPWVGFALVQDQWRSVLFRDQRGAAAGINDGVWALGMLAMLPFALAIRDDWVIAATWGAGAALAALVGFWQVKLKPSGLANAVQWWRRDLRRLGSWLAIENVILTAGGELTVVLLAGQLGAADLGGIRSVEVVFAPMTLVGEALSFPGIPILSRALATSLAHARRWAWQLGFGATALVGLYLAIAFPLRVQLLTRVFGQDFARFAVLALPIALAQLLRAVSTGFSVLIKADARVHAIVVTRALTTGITLVLGPLFAALFGLVPAVWGLALGSAIGSLATIGFGLMSRDIPLWKTRPTVGPVV